MAFFICMLLGPMLLDVRQRQSFDSTVWKSAAWTTAIGPHDHIRLRMVDDLLNRHKLAEMSRMQLEELLGQPSSNESIQTPEEYIYYLGPERGFICIDDEWLDIKFNGERVISAIDVVHSADRTD